MNSEVYDIAVGDHGRLVVQLKETGDESAVALYVRANMEAILLHYSECTRGACYYIKFKELIQPYFNDVKLLDKILRSDVIKEKPNVILGKTGARIFDKLLFQLKKCNSREIWEYLVKEFD